MRISEESVILILMGGMLILFNSNDLSLQNTSVMIGLGMVIVGLGMIYLSNREIRDVDEEIKKLDELVKNSLIEYDNMYNVYVNGIENEIRCKLYEDVDYYVLEIMNKNLKIVLYKKYKNFIINKNKNLIVVFNVRRNSEYEMSNDVEDSLDINSIWLRRYKYKYVLNDISKTKELIELNRYKQMFEI